MLNVHDQGAVVPAPICSPIMDAIQPSSEQLAILQALDEGKHVVCDACAGSGKTTTCLMIVKQADAQGKRVLTLTYTADLKAETRAKIAALGLGNRHHCHSYHAACIEFFEGAGECHTDVGIAALLRRGVTARPLGGPKYDVLCLDEQQDVTPLLFQVIASLIRHVCAPDVQLVVLGGSEQTIFGFRGSDARFLTHAPEVFAALAPARAWQRCTLHTSYRLPQPVVSFVNTFVLGYPKMRSARPDEPATPVTYMHINVFESERLADVVEGMVRRHGPGGVYVLAGSVRAAKGPICGLENALVRRGVPVFVPTSDEDGVSQRHAATVNKVAFLTFHQAKGLERPAVLVMGFDMAYYKYFARDAGPFEVPHSMYVGTTRPLRELAVAHHASARPHRAMPLVTRAGLRAAQEAGWLELVGDLPSVDGDPDAIQRPRPTYPKEVSVTDLLRHLDGATIAHALARIQHLVRVARPPGPPGGAADLPAFAASAVKGSKEDVADLVGLAIPALYELECRGECAIYEHIMSRPRCALQKRVLAAAGVSGMPGAAATVLGADQMLAVANVYTSMTSRFKSKLAQVPGYDWLPAPLVAGCLERLRTVPRTAEYELELRYDVPVPGEDGDPARADEGAIWRYLGGVQPPVAPKVRLHGRVDAADAADACAWEFKVCRGGLTDEHVLQAALYLFAMRANEDGGGNVKLRAVQRMLLFDILHGEVREVEFDADAMHAMTRILLDAKYASRAPLSDEAFLRRARQLAEARPDAAAGVPAASRGSSASCSVCSDCQDAYAFLDDAE